MPLFQQSNDSVDQAKGSAQGTADQTKRAAGDVKDDVKQWGRSLKDSASDSWEQTKGWGKGTTNELEGSVDSTLKQGDSTLKQGDAKKDQLLDLGHPLINRVFDGFVKVAGVGAIHSASKDTYKIAAGGDTSQKSLETSAHRVWKEALQWGVVGGVYSGVTYGIEEARGVRDWKTALVGGLVTGAALSLTEANAGSDRVINGALTGAAIATAGEFLRSIN